MRCDRIVGVCTLIIVCSSAFAQEQLYSISVGGSFTTSSKLFYAPNDPDFYIRHQHFLFDNILGFSIDLRRSIEGTGLQIGINAEYLSATKELTLPQTSGKVKDGFIVIPIEVTGYFMIPFSSETFQIYMGGGGGCYWGNRVYVFNNVRATTVDSKMGYGIHILSGVQYTLLSPIAVRCEVKFRDIQFKTTNIFPHSYSGGMKTEYPGNGFPLDSRVSVDGMNVSLGLVVNF